MNPAGPGSVPSYPLRTNSSKCNCWVKSHRHSSSNKGTVTQAGSPSPTGLMAKLRVRAGCPRGPEKTSHPAGDRKVCPPPAPLPATPSRLRGVCMATLRPPLPAAGPPKNPSPQALTPKPPLHQSAPSSQDPARVPHSVAKAPRNSEDPA